MQALRPSDEQSIRDELTLIARDVHLYDGGTNQALAGLDAQRIADAILASPVIRRIQAEAGAEALRSYRTRLMGQHIDRSGIVLPDLHEVLDDLDDRADRIEQGER